MITMEGALKSEFKDQKEFIKINNFSWNTRYMDININGRIFKNNTFSLHSIVHGNPEKILYPILKDLNVSGFMYGSAKIKKNREGRISINGNFKGSEFYLAKEKFTDLTGSIKWDSKNKNIKISTSFTTDLLSASLKVNSKNDITRIIGKNADVSKVAKILKLYSDTPLAGVVRQADIVIKNNIVSGVFNLERAKLYEGSDFNLAGNIKFRYSFKDKWSKFYSDKIQTEFGKLSLDGESLPSKKMLSVKIGAEIDEVGNLNKYSKYYLNLDLSAWNLKKGKGHLDLNLKKIKKNLSLKCDFDVQNFYSNGQKVDFLKGQIESDNGLTRGNFIVDDNNLIGKAELHLNKDITKIDFKNIKGESEKALKILNIDLLSKGEFTGDFVYTNKTGYSFPLIAGRFKSEKIKFYSYNLNNISGDLSSDTNYVALKNLKFEYKEGRGNTDVFINFVKKNFKINGTVKNVNLNKISKGFKGIGEAVVSGEGDFFKDPIKVNYQLHNVFFYTDKKFSVNGSAEIFTNFSDYFLETKGNIVNESVTSPFIIRLDQKNDRYLGSYMLNLKDINLLIPWGLNRGEIILNGEISSQNSGKVETQGYANFKGERLTFPNFPHTLDDFFGRVMYKNLDFTLQSLQGTMGDGKVEGNGYVIIKNNELSDLLINIVGRGVLLYPMDKTSFTINTRDLNLKYVNKKLFLRGTLTFSSGLWEREIDEDITFYTDPSLSPSGSKILDMLKFDLKLVGQENIWLNNSSGKARLQFNLKLTGNPDFPILTGMIESREGELYFSDKKFTLIKGKLLFNNKFLIDPIINIESEAFLKNYRIKFNIKGTSSHYKPEFKSSPPLPPQDILALISLGELFRGPTSTQISSRIGTGSTGLFATEILTNQIKKRTKKLFGNYLLRLDPTVTGTSVEDTTKIIIGKSISKDFLIVYSTNFATSQKEVWYLKYQISPSISLIGMKNEEGRLSFDISFRKRH